MSARGFPHAARERYAARPMVMRNTLHTHHVDTARLPTCPPCHGNCQQGDTCPARSRRLTEADLDRAHAERERMWRDSQRREYPTDRRLRAPFWMALALIATVVGVAWVFA